MSDPAKFTTQTIADALKQSDNDVRPEFLRLPKVGEHCPVTGLSRGLMNLLILPNRENGYKPFVKSFTLRRRGNECGVRLVDRADLVRYIREHVEPTYQQQHDDWSDYEI